MKQFEGKICKLTKISSKRANPNGIGDGYSKTGQMIINYLPKSTFISGPGIRVQVAGLLTSPVIGVVEETSAGALFETEGGVYKLELQSE